MFVRTSNEQPLIFSIALFLISFVIPSEIPEVEAYSLITSCNSELKYDFKSPIFLNNNKLEWDQNNQIDCNISVKIDSLSIDNIQTPFIIKFETECEYKNESLLVNIFNDKFLSKQNLCEFKNQTVSLRSFLLINASQNFLINLVETKAEPSKRVQFKLIKSITITSFVYANQNGLCPNKNDLKCGQSSNICIDQNFKCLSLSFCPDNSEFDRSSCKMASNNSNLPLAVSFTSSPFSLNNTNITQANIIDNSSGSHGHALSFFVGVLIILIIITSILIGVWLYGRRKRKWREFLAQLENNTVWDYEQLTDDGPTIGGSRATISPAFNMNVSNEELSSYNYNSNSNQNITSNKSRNKINERTHIID